MSRPASDPTRWFTDLINSQKALLAATFDGAEVPAAKQWTDALTSFTKWQMDSWNQLTTQWAAMFGMGPSSRSRTGASPARRGPRTRASRRSPAPT